MHSLIAVSLICLPAWERVVYLAWWRMTFNYLPVYYKDTTSFSTSLLSTGELWPVVNPALLMREPEGYSHRDELLSQDLEGSIHPPIAKQKFKKLNSISGGMSPDKRALLPPFCLTSATSYMQITLLTLLRRGQGHCTARATPLRYI